MPSLFEAYGIDDPAPEQVTPPPPEPRSLARTAGDYGISALKGAIDVPEAAVGLADLVTGGYAGKAAHALGFRPDEAKAMLDEVYSDQQKQAFQRVQAANGFLDTLRAAAENPSVVAHSVVESLPSMGAGGVVGRGVVAGAEALSPRIAAQLAAVRAAPLVASPAARATAAGLPVVGGAIGEGTVQAGQAAEQIRQGNPDGLLTGRQAGLAAASGAADTLISMAGGKLAQRLGIGDIDTLLAGGASPEAKKGIVRRVIEGMASEGILEELPQSIQEQVLQNAAQGKPLDDGVDQNAVLGMLSGMAMGGGANALHVAPKVPEVGPLSRAANAAQPAPVAAAAGIDPGLDGAAPMGPGATADATAAPTSPAEPMQDPVLARINALEGNDRSEALAAYNILNREDAPKGVRQYNSRLLDDLLAKLDQPKLESSDPAALLSQGMNRDPLQGALQQKRDEQTAQANLDQWMARAPAMPLQQVQEMKAEADAQGMALTIVPHGAGQGFTLVPEAWITPAMRGQVGAALPMDTTPTGVIRSDASGNAQPETGVQRIGTAQAKAAADAERERKNALGLTPDVEAVQSGQKRAPLPTVQKGDVTLKTGQPFKNKGAAVRAQKAAGGGDVVQVQGGWVVRTQAAAPAVQQEREASHVGNGDGAVAAAPADGGRGGDDAGAGGGNTAAAGGDAGRGMVHPAGAPAVASAEGAAVRDARREPAAAVAEKPTFAVGDQVHVVDGLYHGNTGHVESINDTGRIVVRADNEHKSGLSVTADQIRKGAAPATQAQPQGQRARQPNGSDSEKAKELFGSKPVDHAQEERIALSLSNRYRTAAQKLKAEGRAAEAEDISRKSRQFYEKAQQHQEERLKQQKKDEARAKRAAAKPAEATAPGGEHWTSADAAARERVLLAAGWKPGSPGLEKMKTQAWDKMTQGQRNRIAKAIETAPVQQRQPEGVPTHDMPERAPGERWTNDRGAIPGEAFAYLDGDADTAKAAMYEVQDDARGTSHFEVRGEGGKLLAAGSTPEEAAKLAEARVDAQEKKEPKHEDHADRTGGEGGVQPQADAAAAGGAADVREGVAGRENTAAPAPAAEKPAEPAKERKKREPAAGGEMDAPSSTEDAGAELTYNKRNRLSKLSWTDAQKMDPALRVREVAKAKVYPRPDYEALAKEVPHPLVAYFVKQAYDALAAGPQTRGAPTDEDLQRYIAGVNRYMDGVMRWAKDKDATLALLQRLGRQASAYVGAARGVPTSLTALTETPAKTMMETVYPEASGGWKAHRDEIVLMGGNKPLSALQPDTRDAVKALKEIEKGWPGTQEAWQKRGLFVVPKAQPETSFFEGKRFGAASGEPYLHVSVKVKGDSRGHEVNARTFDGITDRNNPEVQSWVRAAEDMVAGKAVLFDKLGRYKGAFPTEDAAVERARELTKTGKAGPEIDDKGISVTAATRTGEARRAEGENISSDQLKEAFGFKGVNFGNWMKGKGNEAERQLHLNHAYDAFHDLADLLGVPPKAMSLDGMLGLAFGAQGNGQYAAHFVPGVNEINLTRTSGAGSLAHEWGHALDHYFARLAGFTRSTEPFLTEHTSRKTEGAIRPEILNAFKAVVQAMNKRPITQEEAAQQRQASLDRAKKNVDGWISAIERDFAGVVDKDSLQSVFNRIRKGDVGDYVSSGGTALRSTIAALREDYRHAKGRAYSIDNLKGLQASAEHLQYLLQKKEADATHVPQQVTSNYAKEAMKLDKDKGGKQYWSTNLEMFARAFDAYVSDTLEERAIRNTYLSHAGRNNETVPQGEERTRINAAIQDLVNAIETKETDAGVAMFSRSNGEPISKADLDARKAAIQEMVAAIAKKWANAPEIVVVRDMQDPQVPQKVRDTDAAQRSQGADSVVHGFHYQGKVYLVAEGISDPSQAVETLAHEVLGHAGLQGFFGEALTPIKQQIVAMRKKEVLAKAADYGMPVTQEEVRAELGKGATAQEVQRVINTRLLYAAEEVLAEMAQKTPQLGFVKRAVAAIRTWLRENVPGFKNLALTDDEIIRSYILPARGWVMHGDGTKSADDVHFHRAFHGSPHNFDRFSTDHIGSGEGNQAYGWGLYFAENQGIADGYRRNLSYREVVQQFRNALPDDADFRDALDAAENWGLPKPMVDVIKALAADDWLGFDYPAQAITAAFKDLSAYDASPALEKAVKDYSGKLYQVDVPDNVVGRMLLWDKGLDEQPQSVQDALRSLPAPLRELAVRADGQMRGTKGEDFYRKLSEELAVPVRELDNGGPRGWGGYTQTINDHAANDKAASQKLDSLGIPGIRYLDEPSRPRGGPRAKNHVDTHNLVVFSDKNVTITHKDGTPVTKAERAAFMEGAQGGGQPQFSRTAAGNNPATIGTVSQQIMQAMNDTFSAPGKLNWWHKTIGTQYNLAQRSPEYKRVFDAVQDFIHDVSQYATQAADMAPKILPKLETWKDIGKAPIAPQDNKAISAPIFEGTLTWARDERGRPVKLDDLRQQAEGLSAEAKAQRMLRAGAISENVLKMWKGLPLDQYEQAVATRYDSQMLRAGVVWTDQELRDQFKLTDGQIALYHEFRNSVDRSITNMAVSDMVRFGGKDLTPEVRQEALEAGDVDAAALILRDHLLQLAEKDPARNDLLIDTAERMIEKADRARDLMDRGYAPLSRFGHYTVDVVDNGERVYFGMFESAREAALAARKMKGNFPQAVISRGTVSQEEYRLFAGVSPETVELFGELLGLEGQGDSEANKAFQTYIKVAKANRSAMKRLIERKGIAGFSEDVGRVLAGFVYSNARQTSQNLHMGEMTNAASEVSKGEGELKDQATRLVQYVKNPQEEAQGFRGLLFAQYLGGSVASAAVNMLQPVQVTFPYLSQFGGIAKAASRMTKAFADSGKKTTGDAALDTALKHAEEEGIVAPQEVFQLMSQASGRGVLQSGDGTLAGNARAKANNAFSRLALGWGKVFGMAEQLNRRVTFIAAYRTAVQEGIAEPAKFAEKAVQETQFVYGKQNKPNWARGAIGSTLFTFKQYSISYLELLHRMATQGGPEGKKAVLLALGMLFLFGGAGGLPFEEDAEDLVDGVMQRLGYNFSSKLAKKQFFQRFLGKQLGQFAENGISGLPGVPIDVSGRLGMGNLIPGTGLLVDKRDHTSDVMEVTGAAGDFAKRVAVGTAKLAQGDVSGAVQQFSPKAAFNAQKALEMYTTGQYKDTAGRKVIDVDGFDTLMKALGFQPTAVANVQEAARIQQGLIAEAKLQAARFADDWAKAVVDGDQQELASVRDRIRRWNIANPDTPVNINRSQIAARVKSMREDKATRLEKTAPKQMRANVRQALAEANQ